jgi:hypothetical protein
VTIWFEVAVVGPLRVALGGPGLAQERTPVLAVGAPLRGGFAGEQVRLLGDFVDDDEVAVQVTGEQAVGHLGP